MPSARWRLATVVLGVIWLGLSSLAAAGEPTDVVKQITDRVLKILEDPQLQGPEKQDERQRQLRQISERAFAWEEMARRALAVHWRERSPQERQEFVQLFRDLVERTYMNRLEQASKEKQDILYTGERIEDSRAVVSTKAVTTRRTEVPLEYRLIKGAGGWQIYDVLIEGVSLINNYRSQFNEIIRSSSYKDLVQKMRSRDESVAAPGQKTQ
jgi:phospholipid transport system substrate-binding protein